MGEDGQPGAPEEESRARALYRWTQKRIATSCLLRYLRCVLHRLHRHRRCVLVCLCLLIAVAAVVVVVLGGAPWVVVVLGISVLISFSALAYVCEWRWTGFVEPTAEEAAKKRSTKKLWDWLQVLGIPIGVALLAFLLQMQGIAIQKQGTAIQKQGTAIQKQSTAIQKQSAATALDAAHEDTLSTYLTQMSGLILDHKLVQSGPDGGARSVARALTLTAVNLPLDPDRKGLVVRFLSEV
jgi:hypothetical protein